ncbi:xylulokinase [Claveliimonas bilis]|uniref:xylulokinase n=1 Tax=Claveliimonas bilis TaxID=3028070 RepID=UPI00292D830B|nr:FGGY family carbohydrate kinase [Claveliimonas bilis]BDZ80752.1 xylulokinase [Claveliimonas bilis]
MKKYIIGMDIGTQSTKVHLYDEKLELVATAVREQFVDTPKPMWMTQKASGWWTRLVESVKEVMATANITGEDVAAFGCCAHMHGAVPVKMDGTVVQDDIQLYSDKRGGYLADQISEQMTDELFNISANMPIPSWHGIKIKWLKENEPTVYEQADKFLTPKDFINFKLTGRACIDYSEGTGVFAMDWKTGKWSDELIKLLDIDKEKLPEIQKSYEIVGKVSAQAAAETGLSTNTVVITGGGDMFSMLYVSGLHRKGSAVDITGTGGVISGYTETPVMDKRIMNLHHVLDGWVPFGNIDAAGVSFRFLRDVLCKKERDEAREKGIDDYAYLCQIAEKIPAGSDGLYFLPYLMGERTMGSADSRGCYIGMSMDKEIGHFIRALLEGVAFEFKRTLDIFEEHGNDIQAVYHVGGGAKGDLWNQIKADIYEKPIYTLQTDEGGVLGVALMASYAVGLIDDLVAKAEEVVKIRKIYEPNQNNFGVYREMKDAFTELHDTLQKPFKHMARVQEKYR